MHGMTSVPGFILRYKNNLCKYAQHDRPFGCTGSGEHEHVMALSILYLGYTLPIGNTTDTIMLTIVRQLIGSAGDGGARRGALEEPGEVVRLHGDAACLLRHTI